MATVKWREVLEEEAGSHLVVAEEERFSGPKPLFINDLLFQKSDRNPNYEIQACRKFKILNGVEKFLFSVAERHQEISQLRSGW